MTQVQTNRDVATGNNGQDAPTNGQVPPTDRTPAYEALSKSEARFRALAEQSPQMIFIRSGGRLVYANPACVSLLGYSRDELYKAHFDILTLLAQGSSPVALRRFESDLTDMREEPFEVALLTRHGATIDAILARTLIEYDGGKAILGILTDITTRKHAERIQQEQQRRMHLLTVKLATAQDEEQRRIAQGLHDDVAQLLAACSLHLAELQDLPPADRILSITTSVSDLLDQAQKSIRSLTFELASSTLYRIGLQAALEELCDTLTTRHRVQFKMITIGRLPPIPDSMSTILFKSVRELLFNVVKHAGVQQALLEMDINDSILTIGVKDQGKGFPAVPAGRQALTGTGLGLFSIEERLRDLGGSLVIDSTPNALTHVLLKVPLPTTGPT